MRWGEVQNPPKFWVVKGKNAPWEFENLSKGLFPKKSNKAFVFIGSEEVKEHKYSIMWCQVACQFPLTPTICQT